VSSHAAASPKAAGSKRTIPYSVVKAALHRLTADIATELRGFRVAVVSIWPPGTQTEGVLAQQDVWGDLSDWNSPCLRVACWRLSWRRRMRSQELAKRSKWKSLPNSGALSIRARHTRLTLGLADLDAQR